MLVVKIGGPAYRIGMGGGAASSVPSGSNKADLDFNAVQVGAACVLRVGACVLAWKSGWVGSECSPAPTRPTWTSTPCRWVVHVY